MPILESAVLQLACNAGDRMHASMLAWACLDTAYIFDSDVAFITAPVPIAQYNTHAALCQLLASVNSGMTPPLTSAAAEVVTQLLEALPVQLALVGHVSRILQHVVGCHLVQLAATHICPDLCERSNITAVTGEPSCMLIMLQLGERVVIYPLG